MGLLVSHPALTASANARDVRTKQVATTVLRAIGIDPRMLEAARREDNEVLPGLF